MLTANINSDTNKQIECRRLAWRCRRGLLELDIVLQRFVGTHFVDLSAAELTAFDAMLDLPDNDFWAMLVPDIALDILNQDKLNQAKLNSLPNNINTASVIKKIRSMQYIVERPA